MTRRMAPNTPDYTLRCHRVQRWTYISDPAVVGSAGAPYQVFLAERMRFRPLISLGTIYNDFFRDIQVMISIGPNGLIAPGTLLKFTQDHNIPLHKECFLVMFSTRIGFARCNSKLNPRRFLLRVRPRDHISDSQAGDGVTWTPPTVAASYTPVESLK